MTSSLQIEIQNTRVLFWRKGYKHLGENWVWLGEIQSAGVQKLTVQEIIRDVGAVDVAGNVECDRKYSKETWDKDQWQNLDRLATTQQYIIPQALSIGHLAHTNSTMKCNVLCFNKPHHKLTYQQSLFRVFFRTTISQHVTGWNGARERKSCLESSSKFELI